MGGSRGYLKGTQSPAEPGSRQWPCFPLTFIDIESAEAKRKFFFRKYSVREDKKKEGNPLENCMTIYNFPLVLAKPVFFLQD